MDDKAQSNTTVLAAFYVTVQHINSSVRRLVCHHCTRVTELNIDFFFLLKIKTCQSFKTQKVTYHKLLTVRVKITDYNVFHFDFLFYYSYYSIYFQYSASVYTS